MPVAARWPPSSRLMMPCSRVQVRNASLSTATGRWVRSDRCAQAAAALHDRCVHLDGLAVQAEDGAASGVEAAVVFHADNGGDGGGEGVGAARELVAGEGGGRQATVSVGKCAAGAAVDHVCCVGVYVDHRDAIQVGAGVDGIMLGDRGAVRVVPNAARQFGWRRLGNARPQDRSAQGRLGTGVRPSSGRIGQDAQDHVLRHVVCSEKTPGHDRAMQRILGDPLLDNEHHPDVVSFLLVHAASLFGFQARCLPDHGNVLGLRRGVGALRSFY